MRYLLLIGCIFLMGCGFNGKLTYPDGEVVEWKSNRPCIIKHKDFEANGKSEPLLKVTLPDVQAVKAGL